MARLTSAPRRRSLTGPWPGSEMRAGILCIVLAMSLAPGLDAIAKDLASTHAPLFICFARYAAAALVGLGVARATAQPVRVDPAALPGEAGRAALMIGAMALFITALGMVPLAEAAGGFLIAPLVATAVSVLAFGERLTREKALGALLGLLGAAMIAHPGVSMSPGAVVALLAGVLLGVYLAVAARGTRPGHGALSALVVQSGLGALMIAPFALAGEVPPVDADVLLSVLALGVLSAVCHLLTLRAYRLSDAATLAPFTHANLVVAIAIGFVLFGEVPAAATLAGIAAIILGGLVATCGAGFFAPRQAPVHLAVRPALGFVMTKG